MRRYLSFLVLVLAAAWCRADGVEPWRAELYKNWKNLPQPPITPYDGPFGGEARAFVGAVDWSSSNKEAVANWKAASDYGHTGKFGDFDYNKDPRPINVEFENACLDDWSRMGYNCAYKGGYFTFLVGSFLKEKGLLGAIDQTLFGQNGPPPLQFDGKEGPRQREGCGSFFDTNNYNGGVTAITGMGHVYGRHLFTVKDHKLTCSWDEVGMRECHMDYRAPMTNEFRKFLKEVWFQDESPDKDSNKDGRTYNAATGEKLTNWDQVVPVYVSLDWTTPGWNEDGSRKFSAMPEVDKAVFEQSGRYKLLVDFHRYFTFEFFRRVNEDATRAMNKLGTPGRITCYPFTQHFIIWPGMNQKNANSFYWYHRLSPVVNVEHCWPEAPVMNLNYAITDHMAPRFKNTIMGWIWFYFGQEGGDMFNGPHDIDRAMARIMGHNVDGTHHWLYSPRYRGRDQKQRLQIAYWQNFMAAHYAHYLSKSAPPKSQIAMMMPDYTGYFYRGYQYPKQDWGWTSEAFQNLQLRYDMVLEEDLELNPAALDGYKALYVVGSEWTTPTIRERIEGFIKKGGVVFANVDSLSLDIPTGRRTDFLEKTFGAKIERKHKNSFYPSTESIEEAVWGVPFDTWNGPFKVQGHKVHQLDDPRAWAKLYQRTPEKYILDEKGKPKKEENGQALRDPSWQMVRGKDGKLMRDEEVWKQLDAAMAKMPAEVRGLKQSPLDMRTPPEIRYAEGVGSTNAVVTWGEVDEAKPGKGAKPIAWWGDKIVGIETEKTVWLGTREGMSIHAISPRMEAHRTTEPCNPFPSEIPELYEANRPYAEALGYAARKAGVTRPVAFMLGDTLPMNLEVLPRVDEQGTMMVVAISHDKTEAEYDVTVAPEYVKKGFEAWDMLAEKTLEADTDGQFKLKVPSWGVSVFMVGSPKAMAPVKAAQAKLNKKDMSVPKYFADRPALNEFEYGVPVPPIGK